MLRFFIALLFVILFLILSIPILILTWLLGKFYPQATDLAQLRIIQGVFRILLLISGTRVTIIGEENVPKDVPVLYVGNHRSIFDIIITYTRCPRVTGYVSKNSVEHIPIFSIWMRRLHCLFLDREDIKEALKTILVGIDNIKNGISMCIFPEGTRNTTEVTVLPFKAGSFKMAEKTGCPIIPMAITNSAEVFENHLFRIKSTHVILEYGEPIYPKELDKELQKKIGTYCQEKVEQMLLEHRTKI
ncbi:MAG: lysophospholipid acyltransferase family protein [Clostridiales bacterium]|nr:lysophospholipid acyltransferase family protein [Clostridiales bacterium]